MSDHDDVLRQHQRKMQMHKQWVEEQHQALKALSAGLVTATASGALASSAANSIKGFPPATSSARGHAVPQPSSPPSRYDTFGAHTEQQPPHYRGARATAYGSPTASSPVPVAPASSHQQRYHPHPQQQQLQPPPFSSVRRTPPGGSSSQRNQLDILEDEANFVSVNSGSPLAVYMRGSQWLKRKEQRMAEQRTLREQAELAQCTFAPNSSGSGGAGSPNVSASRSRQRHASADRHSAAAAAYPGEDLTDGAAGDEGEQDASFQVADVALGVLEHVERLDRARRLIREREERLNSVGSGWTPEPTSVEPFQLGHRIPSGTIRALRQPISAPHRSVLDPNVYQPFLGAGAVPSAASPRHDAEHDALPAPGTFSKHMRASDYASRTSYAAQRGTPGE